MKKILLCCLFLFMITGISQATLPYYINYQGNLMDNGIPVNGNKNIVFAVYDHPTAGNLKWLGSPQTEHFTNGLFSCKIGEVTGMGSPAQFSNISWGSNKMYLQISIEGQVLLPREQLSSVPYSLYAKHVENEFPPYTVVMYCGLLTQIPPGWALCDGRTVNGILTPDFTGMFIQGSAIQSDIIPPCTTAGSDNISVSLIQNNIPQHGHSYSGTTVGNGFHSHAGSSIGSAGGHSHTLTLEGGWGDKLADSCKFSSEDGSHNTYGPSTSPVGDHSHTLSITSDGSHTHTYSGTTGNYGASPVTPVTFDNRPRFRRVAFIMKLP